VTRRPAAVVARPDYDVYVTKTDRDIAVVICEPR
jgi:hypothetical protein